MGVDSSHRSDQQHPRPGQVADVLNHLFETRLSPEGRPYTLTEVAKGTGLSVPYLSILRKGTISSVQFERIEALARFFHVSLDYFSRDAPPVDSMDDLIRDALAKPLVREVALRAGKIGTAQRALVLQMLEHADQVLQELESNPAPPAGESRLPRADAPTEQES
jgi:transcriptional regulator with XRE-family HTH domain